MIGDSEIDKYEGFGWCSWRFLAYMVGVEATRSTHNKLNFIVPLTFPISLAIVFLNSLRPHISCGYSVKAKGWWA